MCFFKKNFNIKSTNLIIKYAKPNNNKLFTIIQIITEIQKVKHRLHESNFNANFTKKLVLYVPRFKYKYSM